MTLRDSDLCSAVFVGSNAYEHELVRASLPDYEVRHVRSPLEMIWAMQGDPLIALVVVGVSCPRGLARALEAFVTGLRPRVRVVHAYAVVGARPAASVEPLEAAAG